MPAPSTCTVSGVLYGPDAVAISGAVVKAYITTGFTDASGNFLPAGVIGSTTTAADGTWSLAVVRTQSLGHSVTFQFEFPLGNNQSASKKYAAVIPDQSTANFSDLVNLSTGTAILAANPTTDSLAEGTTNLYFTQARARAAISATAPIVDTAGVISIPKATAAVDGYLSAADFATFAAAGSPPVTSVNAKTGAVVLGTDDIAEGTTNKYYTDARASAAAPVQSVAGKTGTVTLAKGDVGLGNVDNTSDATKNAATATLTNKTLTAPVISTIVNTGTLTLPTTTDTLVGRSTTDTLTNKTLTSPVINSPTGLVKADVGLGNVDNTSDATKNAATVTLTNKTLTAPVISTIVNTGTLTLPTATDTIVGRATTDTLTNKTIAAGSNTISGLANANLSGSAAITNANLATMAAHTFKGNNTGSSATPADLTATQLTAELNAVVGDSGSGGTKGLVPAPASGDAAAGKFLKADGTWATPSGGGTYPTAWAQYTPTYTGLGTVSGSNLRWRQTAADSIEIQGYFTAGTGTGVTATVSLPSSKSTALSGVLGSSTSVAGVATSSVNQAAGYYILIDPNTASFSFGYANNGAAAGISPRLGSSLFANGERVGVTAVIPIQ